MVITRNTRYVEMIMEAGECYFGYNNSLLALQIMETMVRGDNFKRLFNMSMGLAHWTKTQQINYHNFHEALTDGVYAPPDGDRMIDIIKILVLAMQDRIDITAMRDRSFHSGSITKEDFKTISAIVKPYATSS